MGHILNLAWCSSVWSLPVCDEDTASSHLTCHPLSYLGLFQQGCYSASWFPACTDHVIGPHQKQNFTLLVGLHGTSVGPKGPTGLKIYHVVCQSLLLTFHPLEIRGGFIVLSSTCHQPPNTEPVTIPLSLVVHATFKSSIPFMQDTLPQLPIKNAVGQCQKPYKPLFCSPPSPHPYHFLQWNSWLSNQTGWEWIALCKCMFTDPDYLLGLHMLRSRLRGHVPETEFELLSL